MFNKIPRDVHKYTLQFLNESERLNFRLVSKTWKLCLSLKDNMFWKSYARRLSRIQEYVKHLPENEKKVISAIGKERRIGEIDEDNEYFYKIVFKIFKIEDKAIKDILKNEKYFFCRKDLSKINKTYPINPKCKGYDNSFKMTVVGDGAAGKTCLLIVATTGEFPKEYVPTVFDNWILSVEKNGTKIGVALWDTAGPEDYDRLRPLSYPETNVFFICYSVISRASFENIKKKWIPEINAHVPNAIKVICGNKIDLRKDKQTIKKLKEQNMEMVSKIEGIQMAKDVGANYYIETSSLENKNLDEAMECMVELGNYHYVQSLRRKPAEKKCILQ